MKTIAIIGQKGGTGKTTVATGLAVAAVKARYLTAVLDLDPQTNAANWKDRRKDDDPAVESIQPGRLRQTLKAAVETGADFVFIDTPGKSDTAAIEAARVADLVLIPVRPQVFDVETLSAVRDTLRIAGAPPAYVVLNNIHPSATRIPDEHREVIAKTFDISVCPFHLSHRSLFAEAPATGQTPHDIEPEGKAAAELDALFGFVRDTLKSLEEAVVRKEASR